MKGFKLGWQKMQVTNKVLGADDVVEEIKNSYNKGYEDGYCEAFIKLFNERAKEIRDPEAYYA